MNFLKLSFFKLTGGRPMKDKGHLFVDIVSGKSVRHYIDKFGRSWMAEGPWSIFRVRRNKFEDEK